LGHYAIALCSQHTLFANFTIWFEAISGTALAASACWFVGVRSRCRPFASPQDRQ
jgi:hypothetical protein